MGLFDKIFKKQDVVKNPKIKVWTDEMLLYYLLIIVHKPCAWMKIRSGEAVDPQSIEKTPYSKEEANDNLRDVWNFLNGKISEDQLSENAHCVAIAIRDLVLAVDSQSVFFIMAKIEIVLDIEPRKGVLSIVLTLLKLSEDLYDRTFKIDDVESAKRRLMNLRV